MGRVIIEPNDLDEIDYTHLWREAAVTYEAVNWVCTRCRASILKTARRVVIGSAVTNDIEVKKYSPHLICDEMLVHKIMIS